MRTVTSEMQYSLERMGIEFYFTKLLLAEVLKAEGQAHDRS